MLPGLVGAEVLRVATFHVEMGRKGPGLMLRDILKGDAQARAVAQVVAEVGPDVLVLQGVDYDHGLRGLAALRDVVAAEGAAYDHMFALRPNTGMATGMDLNGDGRTGGPADAQGFGYFAGQRGMAVLSRWPVVRDGVQDFGAMLWRDLPGAEMPVAAGAPFPSEAAQEVQRLSSVGHWVMPVETPGGVLSLLVFHATPPVFDGPEDRNGLRNADEVRLWQRVLDGEVGAVPEPPFVIAGVGNVDPERGEGRRAVMRGLLQDARLQDPGPRGADGRLATVDWPEPTPGDLRVSYLLPSAGVTVVASGVYWPHSGRGVDVAAASRHRLVWVDLEM